MENTNNKTNTTANTTENTTNRYHGGDIHAEGRAYQIPTVRNSQPTDMAKHEADRKELLRKIALTNPTIAKVFEATYGEPANNTDMPEEPTETTETTINPTETETTSEPTEESTETTTENADKAERGTDMTTTEIRRIAQEATEEMTNEETMAEQMEELDLTKTEYLTETRDGDGRFTLMDWLRATTTADKTTDKYGEIDEETWDLIGEEVYKNLTRMIKESELPAEDVKTINEILAEIDEGR